MQRTNFHQYQLLRMHESPAIDITLVASSEKPGGIDEPAMASTGPALANAIFAATGKRFRQMPFAAEKLKTA